MATDLTPWATILVISVVTFLNRIVGPILMNFVTTSARVERYLDAMSISVVSALIASILAQGGWREATAVGLSALIMMQTKSAIWAMLAGICVAALWAYFFP